VLKYFLVDNRRKGRGRRVVKGRPVPGIFTTRARADPWAACFLSRRRFRGAGRSRAQSTTYTHIF